MLKKLLVLKILMLCFSAMASSPSDCNDPTIQRFLNMDYKSFDQSPPNGGWRALKDKGRDSEIVNLLDRYAKCRKGLTSDQTATLVFHSGQIFANLGENEKALERFARSYDDKLDSKYHWNSFVDGTIAFIRRDAQKLRSAKGKIEAAEKDHPYVKTLNNLITCFGKPYKDVGPDCEKPAAPAQPAPPTGAAR